MNWQQHIDLSPILITLLFVVAGSIILLPVFHWYANRVRRTETIELDWEKPDLPLIKLGDLLGNPETVCARHSPFPGMEDRFIIWVEDGWPARMVYERQQDGDTLHERVVVDEVEGHWGPTIRFRDGVPYEYNWIDQKKQTVDYLPQVVLDAIDTFMQRVRGAAASAMTETEYDAAVALAEASA